MSNAAAWSRSSWTEEPDHAQPATSALEAKDAHTTPYLHHKYWLCSYGYGGAHFASPQASRHPFTMSLIFGHGDGLDHTGRAVPVGMPRFNPCQMHVFLQK
eukprot:349660-Chlamydomonas_euryale.AAC.1